MSKSKTFFKLFFYINFLIINILIGMTGLLRAQNEIVTLWSHEIPNSIQATHYKQEEVVKNGIIEFYSKVTIPTLAVFVPESPNGTAVVICPGGGYANLYMNGEGYRVAKWLNTLGITAFVLKYRLPSEEIMKDKTIGPLQDAQESIRYVRRNAAKWNLNAEKIGIMGFSAGGHLASTLSTHFNDIIYPVTDNCSARPDFSILVYPVISMNENLTHKGSRTNLLGVEPSSETIQKYSNEKQITSTTPPTFIAHAMDDKSVSVENSIQYFLGLKTNSVPSEVHFFQNGKHGFGLGRAGTTSFNWTKQLEDWLRINAWGK